MSSTVSHDEFVHYMSLLQSKIDDGFKGVHTRQDTTNGRIDKAESRLLRVESAAAKLTGGVVRLNQIKGKLAGAAASGATILGILKWAYDTFGHVAPKP